MTSLARLAGFSAVAAGWLVHAGWVRLQYPDPERYPVQGVDVSHHQGAIDWTAVAGRGLAFAYVKASEGGDLGDPAFERNWRGAQEAGLAAGAYHYYSFCKPGAEQAANFIRVLSRVRGPMLPPAVDLEFTGNCGDRPPPEDLARELKAFSGRVERALGAKPVFYVTGGFWERYRASIPPGGELWVRSVVLRPERGFPVEWRFWQFASRARVPGVKGPVDLDVFCGSEEDWRHYLRDRVMLTPDEPPGVGI
ncbi:MAG: lysozyme [Elusimicrobia bacterium]|nr:lysozyme [Elusimicrobiota bacterium]